MKLKLVTLILTILFSLNARAFQDKKINISNANKLLKAYEELKFEKMASYWHDSIVFKDVMLKDLYKMDDTYIGKEKALSLWKAAFKNKPNYIKIDVKEQFTSGNYVVTVLSLEISSTSKVQTAISKGEMFTVFKFDKEGKIVEHSDYGDYYTWDRQSRSVFKSEHKIERVEEQNVAIAKDYLKMYSRNDLNGMEKYYTDTSNFIDPTANDAFNTNQYVGKGKESVLKTFKEVFDSTKDTYFNFDLKTTFYSGNYVMMNSTFSMILPDTWSEGKNVYVSIPVLTILKIKNGKILEHIDYANYDLYKKQIKLQVD